MLGRLVTASGMGAKSFKASGQLARLKGLKPRLWNIYVMTVIEYNVIS